MTHLEEEKCNEVKQQAVIIANPRRRVYDLTDDNNWEVVKNLGQGQLGCPSQRCSVRFQKPRVSSLGTRYLSDMPGQSCRHFMRSAREITPHGEPTRMSDEHLWFQKRLQKICQRLGYVADLEDSVSHSDVLVYGADDQPAFSLELQRWDTDFKKRTQARQAQQLNVIWFIPEDAKSSASTSAALFEWPAVRLLCLDGRGKKLAPWDNEAENRGALLYVQATVAFLDTDVWAFRTRRMDCRKFLSEVLTDQRKWYKREDAAQLRLLRHDRVIPANQGLWILESDVANLKSHLAQVVKPTVEEYTQAIVGAGAAVMLESTKSSDDESVDYVAAERKLVLLGTTDGTGVRLEKDQQDNMREEPAYVEEWPPSVVYPAGLSAQKALRKSWWQRLRDWSRTALGG